ncbi:GntR family transcriptional regulator [Thermoactinomyces sp. CICC 10521]|uniref:GntR family transcriptional regulator n=1 Tax=Thermoactinomyces sp. CICC 10521 TaxID=2767426 RepID=UPI0018DD5BA4|nr:GntR family transcriptional regulator [Thermoactinomyces sp. CICC 10521]MBH8607919.1 GntR family transcriptional regulator [Thermoactinomyces sp. CICC 10521]
MKKVSKKSPVPLYYQLKEILQEMIENEELKPGDAVPPERELCEVHGISRMTARKAVMALVNEGVLFREQGKGTFVAEPKPKHLLTRLRSFTEEMEEQGFSVRSEILSFSIVEATLQLKKNLKMLPDQSKVVEIKRLRYVDELPYALETVWLNHDKVPGLTQEKLEGESLYTVLKNQYQYHPAYARQTIEPISLNDYESKLLGVPNHSLAILFSRTTYLEKGEIMEFTKCIYRTDRYKYEIVLQP